MLAWIIAQLLNDKIYRVTRSTVKSHVIQSTEEDDEDLELVVDSDENNDITDNNKGDDISPSRFA